MSPPDQLPAPPHTVAEDLLGLITGVFAASLGVLLLQDAGAVTGGTAGLALLLSYATTLGFGVLPGCCGSACSSRYAGGPALPVRSSAREVVARLRTLLNRHHR